MSEVINRILYGIDLIEIEDELGYWETSTGAEFGEKVLNSVNEYVDGLEQRIAELEARLEIGPRHNIDGIDARDETIRLLERKCSILESERDGLAKCQQKLAEARAALKDIAENVNMEGLAGKLTKIARKALAEKDDE